MIRGGFNEQGEFILFMQGGLKLDRDLLPAGSERVPVTLAAVNIDTGAFDVFGRVGPNLATVQATGNYKNNTFEGRLCVAGLCRSDSSQPKQEPPSRPREQHDTGVWCGKVGCE